jgi:hypothetical protein
LGLTILCYAPIVFDVYHKIDSTNWNVFYFSSLCVAGIVIGVVLFDKKLPALNIYLAIILGSFAYRLIQELEKIGWDFNSYSVAINDPINSYILIGWVISMLLILVIFVKWK